MTPFSLQDIAALAAFLDNRPMTVIAAMKCQDYLLIAGDGEAQETGGLKMTFDKVRHLPDRPVAWGTACSDDIGQEFGQWLLSNAQHLRPTLNEFRDAVSEKLSSLNGRRRKMMQLAGTAPHRDAFSEVLIAAYIDSEPHILDLGDDGRDSLVTRDKFWAIGGGGPIARTVYFTLRAHGHPFSFDVATMKLIMRITLSLSQNVGHPLSILKISPAGVEAVN